MESRRDYRKLMNIKKRNKTYAKMAILGALGLGIGLANNTTTHAESREWKANETTTIKSGDTEYKILWGDTLSLISRDSGITMDTLATLNNILNQDLIFEGNILTFGNGSTAVVKDSQGNVIAETPLTQADKDGIKELQNKATNNASSNVNNSSSSTKTNGTATNTNSSKVNNNNGVINTVKPVKPTENNGGNTAKPKPVKPVDPIKPVAKEYVITINHIAEDGTILSKETRKAKENTTVEAKAIDFKDRGYELVGESTQTVNIKEDTTITFKYKKVDTTKPEVKEVSVSIEHIGDDGKVLSTETRKVEKDSTVKADAKDFTEMGYVLNDEISKSVKASEDAEIKFNYRKIQTSTNEDKYATKNVDVNGKDLGQTVDATKFDKVSEDTKQTVEKLPNGNTITTHTTTIVWKAKETKPVEPTNEDKYAIKNVDVNGADLGQNVDATKFDKVSEDTKQTVEKSPNGNTITTHTTTIVWKAKETKPTVPTNEDRFVTINKDTTGKILSNDFDISKYTEVGSQVDDGVVETLPNGNTITTYTTTITWELKDIHVPETIHTYEQNVVDQNGVFLGGVIPNGYTEVSRSTVDKQSTEANGDTIIAHITTIIVKKDATPVVPSDIGNSGMQFGTRMEAHNWVMDNQPENSNRYGVRQMENGKWTVDFM